MEKMSCYACRETGHTRRECPKAKTGKCFKCGETGYFARDCGKNRGKSGDSVSSTTASVSGIIKRTVNAVGNSHAKYFKDASLDGQKFLCYNDLGSSVVALREADARRLKLVWKNEEVEQLVGYGSGTVKPLGILTAHLSIDGVEAWVDVHVVPDSAQTVPLLMGHLYTEQRHVMITSRSDELLITSVDTAMPTEGVSGQIKTALWCRTITWVEFMCRQTSEIQTYT